MSAPLGNTQKVGIVVEHTQHSDIEGDRLRRISSVIDQDPVLSPGLIRTLLWASTYYQQPLGELIWTALPQKIRGSGQLEPKFETGYSLTKAGSEVDTETLSSARVQKSILDHLRQSDGFALSGDFKSAGSSWSSALRALVKKDWIVAKPMIPDRVEFTPNLVFELTDEQREARDRIIGATGQFSCLLLHGVTGSGKTEVYLHAIAHVLQNGGQALLLVPEIGLTPQLEQRVRSALGTEVEIYHSGQTEGHRHRSWWLARTARTGVVIGTRSAVFLPFQNLSLIVIDEEHDTSFKQHERARYHARAVAIHRAACEKIPVVCGTATPSLESVYATKTNRMAVLSLSKRATEAAMPTVKTIDLNNAAVRSGVSAVLLDQVKKRIDRNEQALIFINRRGFSPFVLCVDCKTALKCADCDANLVYHHADALLHCHHCLKRFGLFRQCPQCRSVRLHLLGQGTQRIEETLRLEIPGARVLRIDRDTTQSHTEFEKKINRIQNHQVDILVGTQMLSKGHHFPNVTLVGVLNADTGFFSTDFRAKEFMIQQILQVAGRSGRADKPGHVLIQTMYPENEIFDCIRRHDYLSFAEGEIQHRKLAKQPPFVHYALLRANSVIQGEELEFLNLAHEAAIGRLQSDEHSDVTVFDIVQSPIARISNRHRAQLLCASESIIKLRRFLSAWIGILTKLKKKGNLRWSIDVDPIDFS